MANKWLDNLIDLWNRLTSTRAGYLDELDFDLNARLGTPAGASLAADLLTIDNLVDDLETAVGAIEGATTLHNKLTAARAALLDQITALRMAELDAANLPADVAAISTELANATYGLSAIETLVDDLEAAVGNILGDIGDASASVLGSIYAILGNPATSLAAQIAIIDGFHDVPAVDAVINAQMRDIIGRKDDTAIYTPDNVSSLVRYLKGLLDTANMGIRPSIFLYEGWQDEAGIDATVWTVTNPATGTAWARAADGTDLMASSIPNANETARLRSNQRWVAAPTLYGTNKVLRRLILEFEMQLATVANLDNTLCIFGLTPAVGNDRSSNDIIGFCLLADVLQTLTDLGGVETTNTGFGETLTNKNKLRIEILLNTVRFYLNETLIATHAANLPDQPMYLNFFVDTEAGGAATIKLGIFRAWTEDIPR